MQLPLLTVLFLPLLLAAETAPAPVSEPLHRTVAADTRRILFHYSGSDQLTLDDEGNLLIVRAGETMVQQTPVVFQRIGGSLRLVSAEYVIGKGGEVALQFGPHDRTQPLEVESKPAVRLSSVPSAPAYGHAGLD